MKEVKAYVRPHLLETIIPHLEKAGARDITVMRGVDALGQLADYEQDRRHIFRKYNEEYSGIAKLEIVCTESQCQQFVKIIAEHGRTGEPGDGRIFVSPIEQAVNIRNGKEGDAAL